MKEANICFVSNSLNRQNTCKFDSASKQTNSNVSSFGKKTNNLILSHKKAKETSPSDSATNDMER